MELRDVDVGYERRKKKKKNERKNPSWVKKK